MDAHTHGRTHTHSHKYTPGALQKWTERERVGVKRQRDREQLGFRKEMGLQRMPKSPPHF